MINYIFFDAVTKKVRLGDTENRETLFRDVVSKIYKPVASLGSAPAIYSRDVDTLSPSNICVTALYCSVLSACVTKNSVEGLFVGRGDLPVGSIIVVSSRYSRDDGGRTIYSIDPASEKNILDKFKSGEIYFQTYSV